ncbi:hypothetical protein CDL15_Pgr005396 [Punica granatum]|uniref:Alpha-dioxygenase 2-like n=1 Tax=Punica granatum TaxID=22663 RepID=A0A218XE62_PUNGR|nr:hypothetical protein CDL15_Pgr005396 [Punica granatum]
MGISLFASLSSKFVHPQLRPLVSKMSFFDAILFHIVHFVDKLGIWHRLPVFIGLTYLGIRRHLHDRYNLKAVGELAGREYNVKKYPYRTADGTFNDPDDQLTGSEGTFFGRNMSPSTSHYGLMDPHPSVVATKLLARKEFADTGKQFNMLACSWIQFMIHDWVDHLEDTQQVEIQAPEEVANMCPLKSFRFFRSKKVLTSSPNVKIGYLNRRTAWWDASAIEGNDETGMRKVRTFKDGKLKIAGNGLLEHNKKGIAISGDVRNSWVGLSTLQVLFIKEHNSVCDMLKECYPDFDDERLYHHARLVTSAVIAKIHTIDWTVELLKTNTLLEGMRINWYFNSWDVQ